MFQSATCHYVEPEAPRGRGLARVLTPQQVRRIRRNQALRDSATVRYQAACEELKNARLALNLIPTRSKLAREMNVSVDTVTAAALGHSYKWVKT